MQRVTRASAAVSLPAAPGTPGPPGYFTGGDPGSGTPATVPGYEWFNGVQEELVALVADAGVTLDQATLTQIRQAARRIAGANVTTLSANTTLTADHAGLLLLSASAGVRTYTLPAAAAANGRPLRLVIVRTDASVNALNLLPAGSDTLNGVTGNCAVPVGATVALVSDGVSAWRLVGAAGLSKIDVVTATGAFSLTVPWWATRYRSRVVGAGGGGGGTFGASGTGGGGGGGGEARKQKSGLTPGASLTGSIGTGGIAGIGGNVSQTSGGNGGSTSFDGVTANGGTGGLVYGAGGGGGTGGTASSGDVNTRGGDGGDGAATGPNSTAYGGTAPGGASAKGGFVTTGGGNNGIGPGGGGSAAWSNAIGTVNGGAGANGQVEVEWMP